MSVAPLDQAAELREAVRLWSERPGSSNLLRPAETGRSAETIEPPAPADSLPVARPLSVATHTAKVPPHVVAVSSGKGGVGKTHVAVNLALSLGARGRRVLLFDADAGTANDDLLLDVDPSPGLSDLLAGRCTAQQAARPVAPGVRFVAGASGGAEHADDVLSDAARLSHTLGRLAGECDVVVLDCGAGVGPSVRAPVTACDLLLLVLTPERTALTDAYALVKTMHQNQWWGDASVAWPGSLAAAGHRPRRAAVLVNQCAGPGEARLVSGRICDVAHRFLGLGLSNAGWVRADRHVPDSLRRRRPFIEAYPRCHAARDIAMLAARVEAWLPARCPVG